MTDTIADEILDDWLKESETILETKDVSSCSPLKLVWNIQKLIQALRRSRSNEKILREALKFYATYKAYKPYDIVYNNTCSILEDGGDTARAALEETKE